MSIWGVVLGAAIGVGITCAYRRHVDGILKREQHRAARDVEAERREQKRLADEAWSLRAELSKERTAAAAQRAQESAWETGYMDGLRDGISRSDAEQFIAAFESGGAATMMLRQRRRQHADAG